MKIKLDENLPGSLVRTLAALGHEADTVPGEGLEGRPDEVVGEVARREGRFLITQDLGFSDRRKHVPGTHPGILLLRLRVPGARAMRARVAQVFRTESPDTLAGAIVVVTDTKIRKSLPPVVPPSPGAG